MIYLFCKHCTKDFDNRYHKWSRDSEGAFICPECADKLYDKFTGQKIKKPVKPYENKWDY